MIDVHDFFDLFLEEAEEVLETWDLTVTEFAKTKDTELAGKLYHMAHNLKGSAKAMGFEDAANFIHSIEDMLAELRELEVEAWNFKTLVECLHLVPELLIKWFRSLQQPDSPPPHSDLNYFWQQHAQLKTRGETTKQQPQTDTADTPKPEPKHEPEPEQNESVRPSAHAARSVEPSKPAKGRESLRIQVEKVENILHLVGELSTQVEILLHNKREKSLLSSQAATAMDLSHKLVRGLQHQAMALRMQPLQRLLSHMEKIALQTALDLDKQVVVTLSGEHHELDKTVTEKLTEPLGHIIRNAIDHGIEHPDFRKCINKEPVGSLHISVTEQANSLAIVIEDDGGGIDPNTLLKTAIKRGLIGDDQTLTMEDGYKLMFQPGFSTSDQVTNTSGRGVGLDAVSSAVQSVGGSIQVKSKVGKGTQFTIILPITVSIVDAIIVAIGGQKYAVPLYDLSEILDLEQVNIQAGRDGSRMLHLRGQALPIKPLTDFLQVSSRLASNEPNKNITPSPITKHFSDRSALVVECGMHRVAFQVEQVCGQQPIFLRQLTGRWKDVPGALGMAVLGNGEPSLVLTLPELAKHHLQQHKKEASDEAQTDLKHLKNTADHPTHSVG